ncbi:MAG TPA: Trp biosynthesis-associated membrane protein [Actinomycetaceae bacterium]|nr:Trp biosynthesis-associated membrane protein [Actinomycetaceae bacterium]
MRVRPALVLGFALSGALTLASVPGTWFSATTATVTGDVGLAVTGGAVPVVGAAAFVLLAAAAALLLAQGVLARVIGGIAALLAAAAAAVTGGVIGDPSPLLNEAARAVTGVDWSGGAIARHSAGWLGIAGLVLGVGAGIAAVVLGGRIGRTARRFERDERPGTRDARTVAMDDWDAIARGEDPTDNGGKLS